MRGEEDEIEVGRAVGKPKTLNHKGHEGIQR